ncbi:hypothetical protein D3C87_488980 [compost metagenome]
MQQLGLSAADVVALVHQETETWAERLSKFESANRHAGMEPDQAQQLAMIQYLHEFSATLLEANNRKIAADLIRLGVLHGSIRRGGEASF